MATDAKRNAETVLSLMSIYNREMSAGGVRLYLSALSKVDSRVLELAAHRWLMDKSESTHFFPLPSDLLRIVNYIWVEVNELADRKLGRIAQTDEDHHERSKLRQAELDRMVKEEL